MYVLLWLMTTFTISCPVLPLLFEFCWLLCPHESGQMNGMKQIQTLHSFAVQLHSLADNQFLHLVLEQLIDESVCIHIMIALRNDE